MSIQIVINRNKKYEVVTVRNGKLLDTTNPQQYNRKAGAFGKIISVMKEYGCEVKYVQDNSFLKPVVWAVYADKKRKPELTQMKPLAKPYVPKSKKK